MGFGTYREACLSIGLIDNDQEWHQCLEEASGFYSASRLRELFATILTHCFPTDPLELFNHFQIHLMEDIVHQRLKIIFR